MTDKSEIILEARDLYFSYDTDGEYSLKGVDLQIGKGKKIAFMGANGSGKSTFFLCCNGIHRPAKGQLFFHGQAVDYSKRGLSKLRSKVGIVFQDPDNQLFSASVFQEISFGILNLGATEEQARAEVEAVMAELNITSFSQRPTHALSGGQKKQVTIADILVMHPEVIIMDEPFSALDSTHVKLVDDAIHRFTERGITVMMAIHDMDYAYGWADEIVLLHEGRVLKQGNPDSICRDKDALALTNLEEPAVLRLAACLRQKGMIPPGPPTPRNIKQLEEYIERGR